MEALTLKLNDVVVAAQDFSTSATGAGKDYTIRSGTKGSINYDTDADGAWITWDGTTTTECLNRKYWSYVRRIDAPTLKLNDVVIAAQDFSTSATGAGKDYAIRSGTKGSMNYDTDADGAWITWDGTTTTECLNRKYWSYVKIDNQTSPMKPNRRKRWSEGLDAPTAGAREFLPSGWKPDLTFDMGKFIIMMGVSASDCEQILREAARKQVTMVQLHEIPMTDKDAQHVLAYTAETPLYKTVCYTMRTPGTGKALSKMTTYIYGLSNSINKLPTWIGRVYRGLNVLLPSSSYIPGTAVCWQAFSSSTKSALQAITFLGQDGSKLLGTVVIIESVNGREVDKLSEFPIEEEVLFKENTFFEVLVWVNTESAKRDALPEYSQYDLANLAVLKLREV